MLLHLAKEWGKGETQRCYMMVSIFTTMWTPIGAKRHAFLSNCSTGNGSTNTPWTPSLNPAGGRPIEKWREARLLSGFDCGGQWPGATRQALLCSAAAASLIVTFFFLCSQFTLLHRLGTTPFPHPGLVTKGLHIAPKCATLYSHRRQ